MTAKNENFQTISKKSWDENVRLIPYRKIPVYRDFAKNSSYRWSLVISDVTLPGFPEVPLWVSLPCHILGFDLKFKGENLMNVLLQDVSVPASKDLE